MVGLPNGYIINFTPGAAGTPLSRSWRGVQHARARSLVPQDTHQQCSARNELGRMTGATMPSQVENLLPHDAFCQVHSLLHMVGLSQLLPEREVL